jgi:ArsR family transcriptional regulator
MGGPDGCPVIPGARRVDWDLPGLPGGEIENMRSIRDEIEKKVAELVGTL